jgi:hypothetical protein
MAAVVLRDYLIIGVNAHFSSRAVTGTHVDQDGRGGSHNTQNTHPGVGWQGEFTAYRYPSVRGGKGRIRPTFLP